MSGRYIILNIDRPLTYAASGVASSCSPGTTTAITHASNLPQCGYHESGGYQCELEQGHAGGHSFDDALFMFLQVRWNLQGPVCRTRRYDKEYIYEYGSMCL